MAVDLKLRGTAPFSVPRLFGRDKPMLDQIADWLDRHFEAPFCRIEHGHDEFNREHLVVRMHPLQTVEIVASGFRSVRISARTSTVGAGYHRHLCDTFQKMGKDLNLRWKVQDPTEYFNGAKPAEVDRIMVDWLGQNTSMLLALHKECKKLSGIGINMGEDQFQAHGLLLTPMGPRDEDWLERTAANPWTGIDIFPWVDSMGPEVLKNWAEALMWEKVRWRKPLCREEAMIMEEVTKCLDMAHRQSPNQKYPWREWLEILTVCGVDDDNRELLEKEAARAEGPLIGYRRHDVRFGGLLPWSVRIPGAFGYECKDKSSYLFDPTRTIQLTRCRGSDKIKREFLTKFAGNNPAETTHLENNEKFESHAFLMPPSEREDPDLRVRSISYAHGSILLASYFDSADDFDWSVNTWRSIELAQ